MAQGASARIAPSGMAAAEGWSLERLTPPSRLYGANGLATGPDGRLYVAQVGGSQVSAIDVDTGTISTISPMGGAIVAPDDLVFDDAGNLYLTEITEGRVSMLTPDGKSRVLYGDMPVANPITWPWRRHKPIRSCARVRSFTFVPDAPASLWRNASSMSAA